MKEYVLNGKKILTTPERYENTFKELGYKPVKGNLKVKNKESEENKENKESEENKENKESEEN